MATRQKIYSVLPFIYSRNAPINGDPLIISAPDNTCLQLFLGRLVNSALYHIDN